MGKTQYAKIAPIGQVENPQKPLSFPFTKNSRISNSNPVSNLPQLSDDEENNWNCQMQLYHIDSVIDLYIHRNISRKNNVSKG